VEREFLIATVSDILLPAEANTLGETLGYV